MILVAGGTGTMGRRLVHLLVGHGRDVRVLTREPARSAALPDVVDVVVGDLLDAGVAERAVEGCSTVVSAVHGFVGGRRQSPQSVDRDANIGLVRAAEAAGVGHVVLLSVHGAAAEHPLSLHRAKHDAEQALRASRLAWTIVRPTSYVETWIPLVGAKIADKGTATVFGPGRNPVNFVSAQDVAAMVDLTVREDSFRGQVLEAVGPSNVSFTELAERLLAASGRRGRVTHVPLTLLRLMAVLARPLSPTLARQAQAAVVMNTTDMAADPSLTRGRFPMLAMATIDDVLGQRATRASGTSS